MNVKLWITILAGASSAYAQAPASIEKSVRAAMAQSLAQQRASVQKQAASARAVTAGSPSSFFIAPFPVKASMLAECDPMPAAELDSMIGEAAQKEGVDAELVRAVVQQESAARPCAVSYKGAQGLMQLMPATADQLEVKDPFDPKENVEAGTKLLKMLLNRYDNDISLALGAYNAGPGRVDREGGIPPIPETLNYVSEILKKLQKPAPAEKNPQ